MPGTCCRWVVGIAAALAACLFAPPARPRTNDAVIVPVILAGISAATDFSLTVATACDERKPEANRALAWSSVAFGVLGIASGTVSALFGADFYGQKPAPDDTEDFHHSIGGTYLGIGVASIVTGVVAFGLGLHDAVRPNRHALSMPRPVVMVDARTGPAPGVAWNMRF